MGCLRERVSPCCCTEAFRCLCYAEPGDDFAFAGPDSELGWARRRMESRLLVKVVGALGGDEGHARELWAWNNALSWSARGVRHEADSRRGCCGLQ